MSSLFPEFRVHAETLHEINRYNTSNRISLHLYFLLVFLSLGGCSDFTLGTKADHLSMSVVLLSLLCVIPFFFPSVVFFNFKPSPVAFPDDFSLISYIPGAACCSPRTAMSFTNIYYLRTSFISGFRG